MKMKPVSRRKRGVALVFALFTAALLVSMSATVVALSMRHARDGSVSNYTDQALQAANWGIEAVINYMGVTENWELNRTTGMYKYKTSFHLKTTDVGRYGIGNTVKFFIKYPAYDKDIHRLSYYGLDYKNGKTPAGEDTWQTKDTRIIEFGDYASAANNATPYKIVYDDGTFAMVTVAMTEILYPFTCQPSQYQLISVSKVYAPGKKNSAVPNSTDNGYLLATRVVEARLREQTAFDFMHYVQNAKAWDVNGTDPAKCEAARNVVGMPFDYKENGRLRIDGGSSVPSTAGNFNFFDENASGMIKDKDLWKFYGDVTIAGDRRNISFNSGAKWENGYDKKSNEIFLTGLRDGAPALGLPDSTDYLEYAKQMAAGKWGGRGTKVVNLTIGGNAETVKSKDGTNIDDVYYVKNTYDYAGHEEGLTDDPSFDITPRISKIQVILDGDKVKFKKIGGTDYQKSAFLPDYGGAQGIPVSSIKNGIITVTGGNVEVVSAYDSKGKPVPFTGNLTIVSDVDDSRETATNNPNKEYATANGSKPGAIYSNAARRLYEDKELGGVDNPPPYSQRDLADFTHDKKFDRSKTEKCIVPVPVQVGSEGKSKYEKTQQEREGNTIIASDIKYGDGQSRLGIVAKNFVLLNEMNQVPGASEADIVKQLKELSVDAVLMSLDHSVQFDWDNWAFNKNHNLLMNTNAKDARTFKLNGAIVSGFLDVEGDNHYRGYYIQNFQHDENIRYQLPPSMPRWDRTAGPTGRGVVWNWMILNYIDNGALNRFN